MKNEQKYNTAEERVKAFEDWCIDIRVGGECHACKLSKIASHWVCFAHWLSLEAENEKPEPCPFCGGMCVAYDKVVVCQNVKCDYRSGSYDNRYAAIAAHNRVARAVMASEESEVTNA